MKLLIIEDEEKIIKALSLGFREEGFLVSECNDGELALNILQHEKFDCIILDLMIPKVDGISVLKQLRKNKNFTPIIILSAKDDIDDKIEGLNNGADDYLPKPFSFDELLARVEALIRRSSNNNIILSVDHLTLDPYKKIVSRNNIPIHITGKDFALLEYLMRHKGSIISEERIISYLWRYNEDINSNVVAAHIKSLRNKIDKSFPNDKQILHTYRGLGYKIDE